MSNPIGGNQYPSAWWKYYEEVEKGITGTAESAQPSISIPSDDEQEDVDTIAKVVNMALIHILDNEGKCVECGTPDKACPFGGISPSESEEDSEWKEIYRQMLGDSQPDQADTKPEDRPESGPKS